MKRYFILLCLLAAALFVAACGGNGGGSDADGAEAVSQTVAGFDDFRFDPEDVSAAAGSQVTINFQNEGALEHSWVLISNDVDPLTATPDDALGGASSGIVPAGEERSFSFSAPPAGAYTVVCTVPGHAAGGMLGTFTSTP